jgi:hypothetical protein
MKIERSAVKLIEHKYPNISVSRSTDGLDILIQQGRDQVLFAAEDLYTVIEGLEDV